MSNGFRFKSILTTLVIFAAFFVISPGQVLGEGEPMPESQRKINEMINLQAETMQQLFAQGQKINAMRKEEELIAKEIEALNRQISSLQNSITAEETIFVEQTGNLKELLQSYQRMGPGSYLEIILESRNLADFLRRFNLLRDISRNTGKLIEKLQMSQEKQIADKKKLTDELFLLNKKQVQLAESMAKEKQLKQNLENYLASLSAERENYERYLTDLQNKWNQLLPLFANAVKEFSSLMTEGSLPPNSLKLTGNFFKLKGSITDQAVNEIIAGDPHFPQMVFSFQPGSSSLSMPEKNLVLEGTFIIQGGNAIKLQVERGIFYGIPLETDAVKELFRDGELVVSLKSLLGGYTLNSMEMMDGYLQFSISRDF